MKKPILSIIFVLLFYLLPTDCFANKIYYLNNPDPSMMKSIDSKMGPGLYIKEKLGFKIWYGHLVVEEFNKYITTDEILEWNEFLPGAEYKGWVYIDTQNNKVHISIVVKDSISQKFVPFAGNGIFELK